MSVQMPATGQTTVPPVDPAVNNGGTNQPKVHDPFDPNLKQSLNPTKTNDQTNNNQLQPNNNQQPDIKKQFDDYVGNLNFQFNVSPEMLAKMNTGEFEDFNKGLNTLGQNIYRTVINDAQKMLSSMKDNLLKEAKKLANSSVTAEKYKGLISGQIPAHKDNSTLVEGFVSKYLEAGMEITDAIAATKNYMKLKLKMLTGDEAFDFEGSDNNNGNGGQPQQRGGGKVPDWGAFAEQKQA